MISGTTHPANITYGHAEALRNNSGKPCSGSRLSKLFPGESVEAFYTLRRIRTDMGGGRILVTFSKWEMN